VSVIDPESCRDYYVKHLTSYWENIGMTDIVAKEQLVDTVMLGTKILAQNEVDSLVSGAVNTTAIPFGQP
jgi:phosphate acetyltransferase